MTFSWRSSFWTAKKSTKRKIIPMRSWSACEMLALHLAFAIYIRSHARDSLNLWIIYLNVIIFFCNSVSPRHTHYTYAYTHEHARSNERAPKPPASTKRTSVATNGIMHAACLITLFQIFFRRYLFFADDLIFACRSQLFGRSSSILQLMSYLVLLIIESDNFFSLGFFNLLFGLIWIVMIMSKSFLRFWPKYDKQNATKLSFVLMKSIRMDMTVDHKYCEQLNLLLLNSWVRTSTEDRIVIFQTNNANASLNDFSNTDSFECVERHSRWLIEMQMRQSQAWCLASQLDRISFDHAKIRKFIGQLSNEAFHS